MEKWKNNRLIIFIVSGIVIVPLINHYFKLLAKSFNFNFGIKTSIIIWLLLMGIVVLIKNNIVTTKQNSKIEVEGVNLKNKDGTYGTADWGTKEEIEEYLGIGKRNGIILGQTEQNEVITLPLNTYLNKNIAVFGSSGSMKSRGFAIPNALELSQDLVKNSIEKDMSLVFTDPKGELYRKLAKYLENEREYDVKVFNLVNPLLSHGSRFIKFVEDETDAQIFSQIVIEGTELNRKSGGDEFWSRGEQNLLKALLLYTIYYVQDEEKRNRQLIF